MSTKIQIIKDQAGTNANIKGINRNPLPLNAFVCDVEAGNGTIKIFDPQSPDVNGQPSAIMSGVPYTNFLKSDGSVPVSALDLKADIDAQLEQLPPTDVAAGYKGLWNASTNDPDLTGSFNNGDWLYVETAGTYNSVDYEVNDIIKYNGTSFDLIPNPNLRIDDVVGSALSEYDLYVDSNYTGNIFTGSSLQPFLDISSAISAATDGSSILVEGAHVLTSEVTLPSDKSIYLYGTDTTVVKYASYNASNGVLFNQPSSSSAKEYFFHNIKFANSGGYGVYIRSAKEVKFTNCDLYNNGWSGNGLNTVLA